MPVGKEAVLETPSETTSAVTSQQEPVPLVSVLSTSYVSRDQIRKQRQFEEARKSGLIPAEKDEEGKDINPHIPQYIAKAPWYLSQDSRPSLKHQRYVEATRSGFYNWYKRGFLEEPRKLKFRPGSCGNCGAMTHSAKDCTDRPRKKGARWTGKDLHQDEYLVADSSELQLDFDGKRDRYGGYDAKTYRLVIRNFELAGLERKKRRAQELKEGIMQTKSSKKRQKMQEKLRKIEKIEDETKSLSEGSFSSSPEDEEDPNEDEDDDDDDVKMKDFDEANAPIGMKDDRTRTTTLNLRIREDTAKYLFNLDVNSAFYDPKTRSMRDNPLKHLKDFEQGMYRGDNAMRTTGEAQNVKLLELFAWEAYKRHANVHAQAQPTQLELMHNEYQRKQEEVAQSKRQELIKKYGGEEHLNASQALLLSQTEVYVEFNPLDGSLKRVGERCLAKSKYNDDSTFGNHSEVWGSWYNRSTNLWGYACCQQYDKLNPTCIEIQQSTT